MKEALNQIETIRDAFNFLNDDLGYGNFTDNNVSLKEEYLENYGHEFRFEKDNEIFMRLIGLEKTAPRNSKIRQKLKQSPDYGEEEFLVLVRSIGDEDKKFAERKIDPIIEFIRIEIRPSPDTVEVINDLRYFRVNKDAVEPMYLDYFDQLQVSSRQKPSKVRNRIEEVFSLKKITRRFYEEFSDIFHSELKPTIKNLDEEEGNLNSYTQLVVNRILFLMFLQEKGWLNENKRYIQDKYKEVRESNKDPYQDFFEPLFFNALNNPEKHEFESLGKIPYLNGGLFERKDIEEDVYIGEDFFEALLNPEEDETGRKEGFLLRYKLSLSESNPSEQELVVDPEFIGRIFEMFMLESERKNKGTFYTPKEITQYMAKNSLKHYLMEDLGDEYEDEIISLVADYNISKEFDKADLRKIKEKIDEVKVVDPAVGSGAFIISMLEELVEISKSLDSELDNKKKKYEEEGRFEFELKEKFIGENLYGVDLDPNGIELCKFRTWLHLIKDLSLGLNELLEKNERFALPNLDFKFFVGNSLVGDFRPVEVGSLLKKAYKEGETSEESEFGKLVIQSRIGTDNSNGFDSYQIGDEIEELRRRYLDAHGDEKKELENQLKNLIDRLDSLIDWERSDYWMENEIDNAPSPLFKWSTQLPEIFLDGGFDIVIGNPPYRGSTKGGYVVSLSDFYQKYSEYYDKKMVRKMKHDLYQKFIFRGFELTKQEGILSYITSGTYFTIATKYSTRNLLLQNKLECIINATEDIFPAKVSPAIFVLNKKSVSNNITTYISAENASVSEYPSFVKCNFNSYQEEIFQKQMNLSRIYKIPSEIYEKSFRMSIFEPNSTNMKLYDAFIKRINELSKKWSEELFDVDKQRNNISKIKKEHIENLDTGDVTILGLISWGGQGLITRPNEDFLAYIDGSKPAREVKERNENFKYLDKNNNKYKSINTVIKEEQILNPYELSEEQKRNGVDKDRYGEQVYVPFEKGFKKTDKFYKPINTYIKWDRESLDEIWRLRDTDYYFRECLFISRGGTGSIKARYSNNSVLDNSGSILVPITNKTPVKYILGIINSKVSEYIMTNFINGTVNTQVSDVRYLPIPIPSKKEKNEMITLVNRAINAKKGNSEENLSDIESEMDTLAESLYEVSLENDK